MEKHASASTIRSSSQKAPTRERILAAALSLFAEKGFEETTVQDIARSVGIKAASLYAHFKGKTSIFRAVLSGAMDSWSNAIEDCFKDAVEEKSMEEGLSNILHRYVLHATMAESYRFWARLYVFPPKILRKGDSQAFFDLDALFGLKLREYCLGRMLKKARDPEIGTLVSCLVRIAWGFIICGGVEPLDGRRACAPGVPRPRGGEDPDAMAKEIRAGVRLVVKGFQSQLEERK